MKLYYAPKTRAGRVRWMLEELGVPYELHRLDLASGEHRTPEYLAVHPLGRVPALLDGEVRMIESAAIVMYLADKYADRGLAPPLGSPSRAAYYQWIIYAMAEIESALIHALRDEKGKRRVAEVFPPVERALDGHEFLVDDRFTAADVIMGAICTWARFSGLLDDFPRLVEYSKRLADRPASKRARAD